VYRVQYDGWHPLFDPVNPDHNHYLIGAFIVMIGAGLYSAVIGCILWRDEFHRRAAGRTTFCWKRELRRSWWRLGCAALIGGAVFWAFATAGCGSTVLARCLLARCLVIIQVVLTAFKMAVNIVAVISYNYLGDLLENLRATDEGGWVWLEDYLGLRFIIAAVFFYSGVFCYSSMRNGELAYRVRIGPSVYLFEVGVFV